MANSSIGPVPTLLAGYFQRGGIKEVLRVAEQVGTGIQFFNAYRKLYPRDPALSGEEYNSILSYLATTAKVGLEVGRMMNDLGPDDPLPIGVIPKNFFLRSKDPLTDQYLVKFRYESTNLKTGKTKPWLSFEWAPDLGSVGELIEYLLNKVREFLGWVNRDNKDGSEYREEEASINVLAIYRR